MGSARACLSGIAFLFSLDHPLIRIGNGVKAGERKRAFTAFPIRIILG